MKHWLFTVVSDASRWKGQVKHKEETKSFCLEEVSFMVLTKMKEITEAYLGKTVTNAFTIVPAYFNDSQYEATKDAGTITGLNLFQIFSDSTAASTVYNWDKKGQVCREIYYFGAGDFNIFILTIEGGIFAVKSTAEDIYSGGEEFDNHMVNHVFTEFK